MQQIEVEWKGEKAIIKEDMVFEVADAVEQHVTLSELALMRVAPGRIQYARLAKAYAALLSVAGIRTAPKEVHKEFTAALRSSSPDLDGKERVKYALQVIDWLLYILMDGAPEPAEKEDGESPKM